MRRRPGSHGKRREATGGWPGHVRVAVHVDAQQRLAEHVEGLAGLAAPLEEVGVVDGELEPQALELPFGGLPAVQSPDALELPRRIVPRLEGHEASDQPVVAMAPRPEREGPGLVVDVLGPRRLHRVVIPRHEAALPHVRGLRADRGYHVAIALQCAFLVAHGKQEVAADQDGSRAPDVDGFVLLQCGEERLGPGPREARGAMLRAWKGQVGAERFGQVPFGLQPAGLLKGGLRRLLASVEAAGERDGEPESDGGGGFHLRLPRCPA